MESPADSRHDGPEPPEALGFELTDDQWVRLVGEYRQSEVLGSLGEYHLEAEIGRGGQGIVYRAVQPRTGRVVAIKRIASIHGASPSQRTRFAREVRALSALNHPNIITVYGSEVVGDHVLLVMEYIDGTPLDCWASNARRGAPAASDTRRDVGQLLTVFEKLCEAVFHAHQRGIIHRDLKPSNVLVDRRDEPHVLDFGLARLLSPFSNDSLFNTHTTGFVGTPAFASPEQFGENDGAVDVRSDIFAIGCMLYQALTGRLPHGDSRSFGAMVRAIQEQEPHRPSLLRPGLNRELDAIVLRALAKRKEDRYPSVEALRDDLRRYSQGLPVLAHPPNAWYQARKLIRRHRLAFSFSTAILLLIVTFAIVAGVLAARERSARLDAEWNAYAASISAASAALRADDVAGAQQFLRSAKTELRNWEWRHFSRQADASETTADGDHSPVGVDTQGTVRWRIRGDGDPLAMNGTPVGRVQSLRHLHDTPNAVSPDHRYVLQIGNRIKDEDESTAFLWKQGIRHPIGIIRFPRYLLSARFSPDAKTLVLWSWAGKLYRVVVPDDEAIGYAESRGTPPEIPLEPFSLFEGRIAGCAFDQASTKLAVSGPSGEIKILDLASMRELRQIATGERAAWALAFSPDGQSLASGSMDRSVTVWSLANGAPRWKGTQHRELVSDLAFSPDGTVLASASWDRSIGIWDAESGELRDRLVGHTMPVESVVFLDAGDRLATMDQMHIVKTWRRSARLPSRVPGEFMRISSLTVPGKAKDAAWAIAVEGHDASWRHVRVSLIDVMRRRRAAVVFDGVADSLEEGPPARPTVCASPGGKWCAIALPNGEVEIWDGQVFQQSARDVNQPSTLPGPAFRLPSSGGGARVIGGNWDVDDHPSGSACFVASISFAADEEHLALCRMDGTLEFWDLKNRSRRWAIAQTGPLQGRVCAISPDDKRIGVLAGDCIIQMFATEDGRLLNQRQLANVPHVRRMVVFSPDGQWFVPLLHSNDIILYDADNLSEHRRLTGHNGAVRAVAFNSDGTRLVSGAADGLIKLWDVPTGQLVATLHGHELDVTWVGFLADGRTLISGGQDNTIRFWDSVPP